MRACRHVARVGHMHLGQGADLSLVFGGNGDLALYGLPSWGFILRNGARTDMLHLHIFHFVLGMVARWESVGICSVVWGPQSGVLGPPTWIHVVHLRLDFQQLRCACRSPVRGETLHIKCMKAHQQTRTERRYEPTRRSARCVREILFPFVTVVAPFTTVGPGFCRAE
jgi:hypothetical protein